MTRDIPYISEEMMENIESIFAHGHSRAKNHDLRLGQWLVNQMNIKYGKPQQGISDESLVRILFNLENQELWDLLKEYND